MTLIDHYLKDWEEHRQAVPSESQILEVLNRDYIDEKEFVSSVEVIPPQVQAFYREYYGWILGSIKKGSPAFPEARLVSFNLEHHWFVNFDLIQDFFEVVTADPVAYPIGIMYTLHKKPLTVSELKNEVPKLLKQGHLFTTRHDLLLALDGRIFLVENDLNAHVRPVAENIQHFLEILASGGVMRTLPGWQFIGIDWRPEG